MQTAIFCDINGNGVAIIVTNNYTFPFRIRLAAAELVIYAVNGQAGQRIARGFSSCAFDFRAGFYYKGICSIAELNGKVFAISAIGCIFYGNRSSRRSCFIFTGFFVVLTYTVKGERSAIITFIHNRNIFDIIAMIRFRLIL